VTTPELSIVLPVHNEADNIGPLVDEIVAALDGRVPYEIVAVDDHSSDDTPRRLEEKARTVAALRIIRHGRNAGQSTAVHSGVRFACAPLIATLDGDGQNDPADIPALLDAYRARHADRPLLIAGHRTDRRDTFVTRASSKIANAVRGFMLKDRTPDTGCGLKLFERDTFLALPYFDHMHRFLPALVLRAGGEVMSVPVRHRPRTRGASHYGIHNRLWVGLVDLCGVMWLTRRARVPDAQETKHDGARQRPGPHRISR
jgi:dolichol-phosphate mannosyltransferase